MEVKEFKFGNRIIKYYSIYELRKEFQARLKEQNLKFNLEFKIIDINGGKFLEGILTFHGDYTTFITSLLPIEEVFISDIKPSFEFAKLQTRIEKKLYMIYLGVSDPEEVEGEIEDVQEVVEDKITQPQFSYIQKLCKNPETQNKINDFLKEFFNNKQLEELTKKEASKLIELLK